MVDVEVSFPLLRWFSAFVWLLLVSSFLPIHDTQHGRFVSYLASSFSGDCLSFFSLSASFGSMLLFALIDDILVNTFMAIEANQH